MGFNQIAYGFNLTSDIIITNTERVEKSKDDILGMLKTFNEAYTQLAKVLTNCIQSGFIVSRKKFNIGTNITYGGFNLEKKTEQKHNNKSRSNTNRHNPEHGTTNNQNPGTILPRHG